MEQITKMSNLADLVAQKREHEDEEDAGFESFEEEELKQPIVPKRPVKQELKETSSTDSIPKIPQRPKKRNTLEIKETEENATEEAKESEQAKETPVFYSPDKESPVPVVPARPKRHGKEEGSKQFDADISEKVREPEPEEYKTLKEEEEAPSVEEETDKKLQVSATGSNTELEKVHIEPVIPTRPNERPSVPQRPKRINTKEKELDVSENDGLHENSVNPTKEFTLQQSNDRSSEESKADVNESESEHQSEKETVSSFQSKASEDSGELKDEAPLEPVPTNSDEITEQDTKFIERLVDETDKELKELQTSSAKTTPAIPSRPIKKPLSRASTVDSGNESSSDSIKSKAIPPPVPKKPSSKIAAFQEMLRRNQEAEREKSITPERSDPSKVERKAFQSNLNNLFALPGMARPGAVPSAIRSAQPEEKEEEDDDDDDDAENEKKGQVGPADARKSRAKGPRGKRLPKSAVEKVEFTDRRTVQFFDIWSAGVFSGSGVDLNQFKPKSLDEQADDEKIAESLKKEVEKEGADDSLKKEIENEQADVVSSPAVEVPTEVPAEVPTKESQNSFELVAQPEALHDEANSKPSAEPKDVHEAIVLEDINHEDEEESEKIPSVIKQDFDEETVLETQPQDSNADSAKVEKSSAESLKFDEKAAKKKEE